MPKVSVCIPNYNNEHYIGEAILSALNQTYSNIEVVVVDNNSTDNSWNIIKNIGSKTPAVRFFKNEVNIGMIGNFRAAFQRASGEYITFLCSDDLLYPEAIELAMRHYFQNPDFAFVFGNIEYSGERTGNTNHSFSSSLLKGQWSKHSLTKGKNLAFLTGTILKRSNEAVNEVIQDLIFFDWYLWLKLGRGTVGFIDATLGVHRYHNKNQTNILTPGKKRNLDEQLKVMTILKEREIFSPLVIDSAKRVMITNTSKSEIQKVSWLNLFSRKNPVIQFYENYDQLKRLPRWQLYFWCLYGKIQLIKKYGLK